MQDTLENQTEAMLRYIFKRKLKEKAHILLPIKVTTSLYFSGSYYLLLNYLLGQEDTGFFHLGCICSHEKS